MADRVKKGPKVAQPSPKSGVSSYLRALSALVRKELASELRSRELLSAMLVFSFLVILVFNFALELQSQLRQEITSGVLWVTLTFAGTLGLNRSMGQEQERDCMQGLLLTPVDRSAIYFGKALANLLFIWLVALIVMPLFGLLYNVNLLKPGVFLAVGLGTVGYSAVGTLLSTMAVQTRTRDVLLPILLFPVFLPVLIAAVKTSNGYLQQVPMAEIRPWVNIMLAYDVIFIAVAMMVYEYVVQE
ncbi:MAG: heme exporter protein CcmB [Anaerolineales bacterium]